MITRPSSLVRDYDEFCSLDPAFKQAPTLPKDATDDQIKAFGAEMLEHLHAVQVARETGDWSKLLVEGGRPTKFTMCQIDRSIWREILDRVSLPEGTPRRIGDHAGLSLLFRLAIVKIEGGPDGADGKIKREEDPRWDGWKMAVPSVVQALDEIDPSIVAELGRATFNRLRGSPK